ncbi:acetyltransferase [Novosphingobium sp. BW1]|uniref:acetyltransferase n=1 Tax=Novosphingobium sp. BW1 TaxID=2592621 RepID=UPI0011DEAB92|nr:acetyltransferase [Novosphingobium sp. BW1]TYC89812.1 acetyltransferase [Novosphingobium sp. BW1]
MILRPGEPRDVARALEIWRAAVVATHGFLTPDQRAGIEVQVAAMLPQVPLWVAEGPDGEVQGFLVFVGDMIEALFVHPDVHGQGFGSALVGKALELHPAPRVDANEQADNALPFYLSRGFVPTGRSPTDAEGRPFPIVHLCYEG